MRSILPSSVVRVLGVAARFDVARSLVVGVSAVAGRDVEIALVAGARAEADPAAVVIGLRLIKSEQGPSRSRDQRYPDRRRRERARCDVTPWPNAPPGRDVVDIEAAVRRVVRIKSQAEQSFLAGRARPRREIEKRRWLSRSRVARSMMRIWPPCSTTKSRLPYRRAARSRRAANENPPATRTASSGRQGLRPWSERTATGRREHGRRRQCNRSRQLQEDSSSSFSV